MSVAVEPGSYIRLSDPAPAHCAACLCSAGDVRFVDFRAAFNGGALVEEGTMAVRDSIDELHLCETCLKTAAEVLAYKPQLHARQLKEIRTLELQRDHWRETARRLKGELDRQLDSALGPAPKARRAA